MATGGGVPLGCGIQGSLDQRVGAEWPPWAPAQRPGPLRKALSLGVARPGQ